MLPRVQQEYICKMYALRLWQTRSSSEESVSYINITYQTPVPGKHVLKEISRALSPEEPLTLPLRLRCNLGLHPPPRLEDHLVPPSLQRRLPLVPIRAPRLALLVLSLGLCLLLLRGQLVVQIISRDQVGLRGLDDNLGSRGSGGRGSGGAADGRRGLEGHRGLQETLVRAPNGIWRGE